VSVKGRGSINAAIGIKNNSGKGITGIREGNLAINYGYEAGKAGKSARKLPVYISPNEEEYVAFSVKKPKVAGKYGLRVKYELPGTDISGELNKEITVSEIPDSRNPSRLGFETRDFRCPERAKTGSTVRITGFIRNAGDTLWLSRVGDIYDRGPVRLGGTWYRKGKAVSGFRALLSCDVSPGEELRVIARPEAPDEPGEYTLKIDLVSEHVAWFEKKGNKTVTLPVRISR